jgi:predicted GNAT family acetyltransferase
MEVKHEVHGNKGFFYVEENGARIAHLSYIYSDEHVITIEHTVVNPGNEGKGIAKLLVNTVVDFARKNGYSIIPVCPYAKKVMEGSDAYQDVLWKA